MGKSCCVLGCPSRWDAPQHIFPKVATRFAQWKKCIYSSKVAHLDDEGLKKCVVCYRHFKESDYEETHKQKKLKSSAKPSINIITDYTIQSVETESVDDRLSPIEIAVSSNKPCSTSKERLNTDNYSLSTFLEPHDSINDDVMEIDVSREFNVEVPISTIEIVSEKGNPRNYLLAKRTNMKNLSGRERKLYKIAKVFEKKERDTQKKNMLLKQRLKEAEKYSKSKSIEKLLSQLTQQQRNFIYMQIKASAYAPRGRRYTLDEKILAISLWKQSSRAYLFLREMFHLPATRTLRTMLQKINTYPGPMKFINQHLKESVTQMSEKEKYCALMWDEVALSAHVDYNSTKTYITGFEDFGFVRTPKFADHALIFMVRGIHSGWKFPLAYFFCDAATKTNQLVDCIKRVLESVLESGLHVLAFVCDQAGTNVAAINKLKRESFRSENENDYCIKLFGEEIVPIYDPPHLIKSIRNNMLTKDLEINFKNKNENERQIASWDIVQTAYKMDSMDHLYKLMPKITAEHVVIKKIKKMRVKHAAQVLSKTMASFIMYHTKLKGHIISKEGPLQIPKKEGQNTAEMLKFFNDLFDSVNGYTTKTPEAPLRTIVKVNSKHEEFWKSAIVKLEDMRFVDKKTKQPVKNPPCLKNWKCTILGFQKLWHMMKEKGFLSLKPRMINQDPLENFFGQIRTFGRNNSIPTCTQFETYYKALLINNLTTKRTRKTNCEDVCNGDLLFTLKSMLQNEQINKQDNEDEFEEIIIDDAKEEIDKYINNMNMEKITTLNKMVIKLLQNTEIKNCSYCEKSLVNNETQPTNNVVQVFQKAQEVLQQNMKKNVETKNLWTKLETMLWIELDLLWINCEKHNILLKSLLMQVILAQYIVRWCTNINRILQGKEQRVGNNLFAKEAQNKYLKTLKKEKGEKKGTVQRPLKEQQSTQKQK